MNGDGCAELYRLHRARHRETVRSTSYRCAGALFLQHNAAWLVALSGDNPVIMVRLQGSLYFLVSRWCGCRGLLLRGSLAFLGCRGPW